LAGKPHIKFFFGFIVVSCFPEEENLDQLMKKQLIPLLGLVLLLVSAVGCTSTRDTSSSRYPSGTRTSKSQGTSFPGIYFPGARTSTQGLPPGQAKKVNGDQSARAYAPGQQKKSNNEKGNGNAKGKSKKAKKH